MARKRISNNIERKCDLVKTPDGQEWWPATMLVPELFCCAYTVFLKISEHVDMKTRYLR